MAAVVAHVGDTWGCCVGTFPSALMLRRGGRLLAAAEADFLPLPSITISSLLPGASSTLLNGSVCPVGKLSI